MSVVHVVLLVVYAVVQNVPIYVIVDMIVVSRELLLMHIVTVGRNVAVRHWHREMNTLASCFYKDS